MFKKLAQKLEQMVVERMPVSPASFNDPVAQTTEWTPARRGGSSLKTHRLVEVHSGRMEFRATAGAMLLYAIFLLVGLGVSVAFLVAQTKEGSFVFDAALIVPVCVGMIFTGIGGGLLYFGTAPIVFDRGKGLFWRGRKSPDHVMDKRTLKHYCELKDIRAIQLISEYCRSNKSHYYSYELNLVLEDASRINVIDHGNVEKIRADAAKLGTFLGKPVWDAA
jgi:hypothetical protein